MKPEIETVKYYKYYFCVSRKDVQASMFMVILGIFLMNILLGFLIQNFGFDTNIGYILMFLNGLGFIGTLTFLRILRRFKVEG